jgi:hypothetical protein
MKAGVLLIVMCCLFLGITIVDATDLRGRVDGVGKYAAAPFPLAKAKVEIKRQDNIKSVVALYRTGRDGMYYFRNIQPGQYWLVVNGQLSVEIQVHATSLQDLGPLLFRY